MTITRVKIYRFTKALTVFSLLAAVTPAFAQSTRGGLAPGVVASQGGVSVTLNDIDAFAQSIPAKDRPGFFDSPKRIQSVIMTLLLKRQLAAAAQADKLETDPLVKQEIELATVDTLSKAQLAHYRKSLKIPDFNELANEYYLGHKSDFVVHGKVDVKHVLVSTKKYDEDKAKARIGKVEVEARAHPDQFDALIKEYSDDPSEKDNQGLIKDATSGRMAKPFAKAAAALKKPGDISPIVETRFGYHVLELVSRQPDRQKPFSEVREELISKLKQNWIDNQVSEYTGRMRGKPLDANPDLVASLRTRYLKPGELTPEQAIKKAERRRRQDSKPEKAN